MSKSYGYDDGTGERVRDLTKELRSIEVGCAKCGEHVLKHRMRHHQKTVQCRADSLKRTMIEGGYLCVRGENAHGYATDVFVTMIKEYGVADILEHRYTHWQKPHKKAAEVVSETWAPEWVARMFCGDGGWKLYEGHPRPGEEKKGYAELIAQMRDDLQMREAVQAAFTLSGVEGIKSFVITPQLRAEKLREEARRYREKALNAEAAAEELDPYFKEYR